MHIKEVSLTKFKRFTEMKIQAVPASAKLVVLTGPNGTGKSAIFEAFNFWRHRQSGFGEANDPNYFPKRVAGPTAAPAQHQVEISFHEEMPGTTEDRRRIFYIRSAYRHEPDFQSASIQRQKSLGERPGPQKLIENETRVRENYERMVALTVRDVFDRGNDAIPTGQLREKLIGKLRDAMLTVFEDLVLDSPGDPIEDGTFFFTKGTSSGFHYKNLSGGEKAGFDLLLDYIVRSEYHTDSVFCVDEPELHMGSRVQARLLRELIDLLPEGCQLWVATHSLGMMREALKIHSENPDHVAFLDTYGLDFDEPQLLTPRKPTRDFWKQVLEVALDDVASLVGPDVVFLCESANDLDSLIYSTIFGKMKPEAEFISVGDSNQVLQGGGGAQKAIGVVAPGTRVFRLIDRDDATDEEVKNFKADRVRVLSRRNIESFLFSDEILSKLAATQSKSDLGRDLIKARDDALAKADTQKATPVDDLKKAGGAIRSYARTRLKMTQPGKSVDAFKQQVLAPLITPDTQTYKDLERDLFAD